MAQSARRNLPRNQPRTNIQTIESITDGIKKKDLDSLESHFNWNVCNDISNSTLKERIYTVESNIKVNADNIQPQSYCLLAYLKSKSGEKEQVTENLQCAIKALSKVERLSKLGYEAVIHANLVIYESQLPNQGNAKQYYDRYNEIKKLYESETGCNLAEHPEVLAMKAFAYGSFGGKKSKDSVKAYVAALSNEKHKDTVEWLFGLALAMNLDALKLEFNTDKDLSIRESILRRVIKLDSAYPLAMLKLAKTLVKMHGINGFQEVEYWIKEALAKDRSVSSLDEAASVYQMMANHNEKYYVEAVERFGEAKEERKKEESPEALSSEALSSKDTILGLGRCYFNMYLNENKARKKIQHEEKPAEPSKNLMDAMSSFETIKHLLRHSEKLSLANIYLEMSKYQQEGDEENYIDKAEKKYKEVIEETKIEKENEKKSFRFVEACFRYSNFLKFQRRFDEEMEFLNTVISTPLEDDFGDIRYVRQSEEKLLSYTQNRKRITDESKAYELQSVIQFNRGNIHSAIFYIKEAIKNDSKEKEYYKGKLGDYLLKASTTENPIYLRGTNQEYLNQANSLISSLIPSNKKWDLEFEAIEININLLIPNNDKDLQLIKEHIIGFERSCCESKKFSQLVGGQLNQIIEILSESKRILDRSMNLVKREVYKKTNDAHYPAPWEIEKIVLISIEEKMEKYLETKNKFPNFSTKLPNLFKFLVEKQHLSEKESEWVRIFRRLRNDRDHESTGLKYLNDIFSEKGDEVIECCKYVYMYAIEVSKKFKIEVDEYIKQEKVGTSETDELEEAK